MAVPSAADVHRATRIFKALSHPHRVRLACALANRRTATQKDLLDEFGWPQSTMARHLAEMRESGLIRAERRGNQVYLGLEGTVTPRLLAAVCQWVHPETGEQFGARLAMAGESAS